MNVATMSSAPPSAMPSVDSAARTGMPLQVAEDDARRLRQPAAERRPLEQRCGGTRAGASGRIASAGGSVTARRTAPSAPTAAAPSATATPLDDDPRGQVVGEDREVEELRVDRRHARGPSARPRPMPSRLPRAADEQAPLDEVPADLGVRVAERLERGDLLALDRDEPRQHDVEQERRDRQEDRPARSGPCRAARSSSLSRKKCESCWRRGIAPSPPYGSSSAIEARDHVRARRRRARARARRR